LKKGDDEKKEVDSCWQISNGRGGVRSTTSSSKAALVVVGTPTISLLLDGSIIAVAP